ncbi:hypothetical protein GA0111570_104309 [Raineyella antarctica]|uniref:Uncharacterized protein n=1 Tax=Raineyella antarctica TaxID=1577474 RepID=A0A1G6GTJ6_9ACTN|nr:hypothetical protein [Raineyella antarctica]SDB84486.1 hypothetical protein GA0111570_104309 [Raineyella antarctica]
MADENAASEVDRADDIEIDPLDVDDREFFTDERPELLEDETDIDDRPDYVGEELRDQD